MDATEILSMARERQVAQGPAQIRMQEMAQLYNGEKSTSLPELGADEKAIAANLAQLGIDQMAMRVASTIPSVQFAVADLGAKRHRDDARTKRDVVVNHWWAKSRVLTHVLPRRARWFFAYAFAPVMLRPDMDGIPCWYERNPLGAYPAAMTQVGDITPQDAIFVYKKSGADLWAHHQDVMWDLCAHDMKNLAHEYEVVEYVGPDEIVVCVVGKAQPDENPYVQVPQERSRELFRIPNRTGGPLVVCPGRITLDKPLGQFDGLVSAYEWQSKLMALALIGQERSVFPEVWIQSAPGAPKARVHTVADPKQGRPGEIQGGSIQKVDMSPNPLAMNLADRMEYIERVSGVVPSEFSGMSASNVRTGRRGDSIMAAAVDFRLQEAQQIFEQSMEEEIRIAARIAKRYSSKQFSFYTPERGKVTYRASLFTDHEDVDVRYAYAGADAYALNIAVGQKLATETLSRETAMELDPMVKDVESEKDRIISESVQRAFLSSVQTQAADPNAPWQPMDFARFGELIEKDKANIYEAAKRVNDEIQKRQLAEKEGQLEGAAAMPGLGMPGAPGTPMPPDAVQDPGASMGNLSQLLTQVRRPAMTLEQERRPLREPEV